MKIKKKIFIGLLAAVIAGAAIWLLMSIRNTEVHTVEFTPKDGFLYFSDLNDPVDPDVNLVHGPQTLAVTMDDGSLLTIVITKNGETIYEAETVYTDNLDVNIPEDGAYVMTLSGEHASGSLNYTESGETKDRGTVYYDK